MFRLLLILIGLFMLTAIAPAHAQVTTAEEIFAKNPAQFGKDTALISSLITASKQTPNNIDSGITLLEKAFTLSQNIGYIDGCAASLLGLGTCYFNKGELEKAKTFFRQSYPYCIRAVKKHSLLLSWYNNMASPLSQQGYYDSAAYYYYKGLSYVTPGIQYDSAMSCVILGNLGAVWLKAAQFDQSLFYARKALAMATAMHDSDRMADAYQNIGVDLSSIKDSAAACMPTLKLSYAIHLRRHNYMAAQMDCCALGINATTPDSAIYYYHQGLALSKRTTMQPLHKIFIGLGYAFLQKKQYDSAALYLNKAYTRALDLHYTDDLTFIYAGLAEIYTARHNYQLANKYQKLYSDLRDSLTTNEKIMATNTLEVRYRTAEKDKQIAEAQLQLIKRDYALKQKNNWILLISSIIVLLSLVFITIYRSARRKVKLEQQRLLNVEQRQQITQLKSVMAGEEKERTRIARELHDGIMVQLAVIKMKLRKLRSNAQPADEDMNAILQQLDNTSRELRQTAHNLMPDMLLETGLTDAIYYYCSSLQKETGLNIIYQHYGSLPRLTQEAELYLYRIIQELLQNIIKHAHASKALVQMNYHPPLLSIAVEDNGIGFDKNIVDAGMGLKSIDSRLRVLNGSIDIQSSRRHATTIFIELNIEPFILTKTDDNANTSSHS